MQSAVNPIELLQAIGIHEVNSVRPVTGGLDTAIWRVDSGGSAYALRVFRPVQAGTAALESAAMSAAATAGIPVPLLHTAGEWNGRPYMLLSWCEGRPMAREMLRQPWHLWSMAVCAGRMQARLHRVVAPPEIKQRRNWMDWGKCDPGLLATLRALAVNNEALLHGDFHPLNVLMSGTTVTAVIDWTTACAGDPRADVARTLTILLLAPVYRGWERVLFSPIRRLLAAGWLRGYTAESGPLADMAPFYVWAGIVLRTDFAAKIGRPGLTLAEADLRPIDRWVEAWRRRM
ncbi:MAG TPA: phosphotransferase [Symbiobacteriaceae bacterium]|jgi:aminoglycoside phosphotransferase (APT) family kinase protein